MEVVFQSQLVEKKALCFEKLGFIEPFCLFLDDTNLEELNFGPRIVITGFINSLEDASEIRSLLDEKQWVSDTYTFSSSNKRSFLFSSSSPGCSFRVPHFNRFTLTLEDLFSGAIDLKVLDKKATPLYFRDIPELPLFELAVFHVSDSDARDNLHFLQLLWDVLYEAPFTSWSNQLESGYKFTSSGSCFCLAELTSSFSVKPLELIRAARLLPKLENRDVFRYEDVDYYSRLVSEDSDVDDDEKDIRKALSYHQHVPFHRPEFLSTHITSKSPISNECFFVYSRAPESPNERWVQAAEVVFGPAKHAEEQQLLEKRVNTYLHSISRLGLHFDPDNRAVFETLSGAVAIVYTIMHNSIRETCTPICRWSVMYPPDMYVLCSDGSDLADVCNAFLHGLFGVRLPLNQSLPIAIAGVVPGSMIPIETQDDKEKIAKELEDTLRLKLFGKQFEWSSSSALDSAPSSVSSKSMKWRRIVSVNKLFELFVVLPFNVSNPLAIVQHDIPRPM